MRVVLVAFAVAAAAGSALGQEEKKNFVPDAQPTKEIQAPKPQADERKGPSLGGEQFFHKSSEGMAEEKWQEAFRLLRKLIDNTPDSDPAKPDLYFRLSELFWERSADISIKAFDNENECLKTAHGKAEEDRCTAQREKMLGDSATYRERAIDVYVDIVKRFPNYPRLDEVLFALAFNYQQKKEPERAKKIYVELIKRYPRSERVPDTLLNVGEIFFEAGQVDQALKAYQKVVDNYHDADVYGYALYKLGWCYYNISDYKNALGSFLKVVEFTQKSQRWNSKNRLSLRREALKDLVRAYASLPDANPDKAIEFFRKIAPEDYITLSEHLAELYSTTGQFEKSNQLYRALIGLQSKSYKVVSYQTQIAFNARNIGEPINAIKELKRLVTLWAAVKDAKDADPKRVQKDGTDIEELLRSTAVTYHRQYLTTKAEKDYALAYDLYHDYVSIFPTGPNSYDMTFYYGELLYAGHRWEEAAHAYEKAIEIKPDGQYTKDAAHATVLSYKKLLDYDQNQKAPQTRGTKGGDDLISQDDGKNANAAPAAEIAPKPIPDNHQRFLKACDLYRQYVKESEYLTDIQYDEARTYYEFNHFDQAVPLFKEIAEKNPKHRLALYAANLLLDIYNLQKNFDALDTEADVFLKLYEPDRDPEFHALLVQIKDQSTFKKCLGIEKDKAYTKAAHCFMAYVERFPQSKYKDKAYYNADINFERDKKYEEGMNALTSLVNECSSSELVPKALYRIGATLHALAIYSQASKFYELFADKFPKDERARDALQNAAVFRQGLGDYDEALKDYQAFLKLVGSDREKAADVFFSMGLIYEKQEKWDKVIDHFNDYLKSYGKAGKLDRIFESQVHIARAYAKKKDQKRADKTYADAFAAFGKLGDAEKQSLTTGLAAVAEARFQMGEAVFTQFSDVKLTIFPYANVQTFITKMGEVIQKKTELAAKARTIFLEVIEFKSPNWAIAALARIGQMFQQLANDIYDAPAPKSFNEDQVEAYKTKMAEYGKVPEDKAVEAYVLCLKKAQELRWFNDYSDLAEKQLAKLNPREYRYASERRARPTFFGDQWVRQTYISKLPSAEQEQ
jgi:tetratricopeptide (TPR) repeat protein